MYTHHSHIWIGGSLMKEVYMPPQYNMVFSPTTATYGLEEVYMPPQYNMVFSKCGQRSATDGGNDGGSNNPICGYIRINLHPF
jgi:hypothetical protein